MEDLRQLRNKDMDDAYMPLEDVNYKRKVQYASMDTRKLREIKDSAARVTQQPLLPTSTVDNKTAVAAGEISEDTTG